MLESNRTNVLFELLWANRYGLKTPLRGIHQRRGMGKQANIAEKGLPSSPDEAKRSSLSACLRRLGRNARVIFVQVFVSLSSRQSGKRLGCSVSALVNGAGLNRHEEIVADAVDDPCRRMKTLLEGQPLGVLVRHHQWLDCAVEMLNCSSPRLCPYQLDQSAPLKLFDVAADVARLSAAVSFSSTATSLGLATWSDRMVSASI